MKKENKKIFARIYMIMVIIFLSWVAFSFIEVWIKNVETGAMYSDWNIFNLMIQKK